VKTPNPATNKPQPITRRSKVLSNAYAWKISVIASIPAATPPGTIEAMMESLRPLETKPDKTKLTGKK
jgi:hypothetical protein